MPVRPRVDKAAELEDRGLLHLGDAPTAARFFCCTTWTLFVHLAPASLWTKPALRPELYVRKKSGTRTSGTEYHEARTRH